MTYLLPRLGLELLRNLENRLADDGKHSGDELGVQLKVIRIAIVR